ncbi:HD domain-containing protein [Nocardioides sp. AX2bis]|uniref:HD domain-containing protein n=1 Tax=Nocardioides sp. AX2bis TaxID=2653157 RepID=UPI0012EFACA0|nr:hypothetical protein [Nocardioides sp. AX2bis]VXA95984.1 Predicted metal-dependent phosphohydrolase, HD superfamily [Nocardioides sp. AX2bis]
MPDADHPPRDLPRAPHDLPWPLAGHPDPAAETLRAELLAAYGGDDRSYHDLRHLDEVLARLDDLADDPDAEGAEGSAVRLAAWFHDGVYDGERDAEERSASWAEHALPGLVPDDVVAEVARLVRMTETHAPAEDDAAGCALSDADLAILAAGPQRYAEYVAAVRREYAHVGDEDFARGRAAVLGDLLEKPRLFHTDRAAAAWEETARANVLAELDRLLPAEVARRA